MNTRESDFWNERSGPRIAPEHFGDIVATAADLAIILSESGTVVSVTTNPLNSALGQIGHWEGRRITEFLAPDSTRKVMAQLEAVLKDDRARPDSIEVNHLDGAAWDFPVRYTLHKTGRDGRVLMLGRDLRPVAELQQRLVRAQLALEKDYEAQRVYETRYRVLLEAARDALVLVDVVSGRMLDLNSGAATLLGGQTAPMNGGAFTQEFEGRRRAEFIDELCKIAQTDGRTGLTVELRRQAGQQVTIHPTLFRNAGERVLLCRIETPAANTSLPIADPMTRLLSLLYRGAAEGIVFVDAQNRVTQANDAFLSMMDVDAVAELRGTAFEDLLSRGGIDLKVITDPAQVGAYATRLITRYGSQLAVEVSGVPLGETGGHGIILREVGRTAALREDGAAEGPNEPAGGSNARALVGSAPLRDIVASMTDVIEKQCIEAAVELTENNRVAAAEMLGLSRQSLYVKLRKYGLLERGDPEV